MTYTGRLAALAALLVLVTGCSGTGAASTPIQSSGVPQPTPSPTTAQQEVIVAVLEMDDSQPTMSDEQKSALLGFLAGSEVNFEQYQEAVGKTLECAEEAGLTIDGPQTVEQGGQPTITWGWNDPAQPDGDPKLGEFCRLTHSFGVEQAYLNSDIAKEGERRQLEVWRPEIVGCFSDNGADLADPDADIFDLLNNVEELGGSHAEAVGQCISDLNISVDP